ncbi:MAG TPA: hypothetical protein VEB21_13660, partial [Terriglobales bacterium]|nr:hypothetical protein [Terriglobales bacterium]
ELALGDFAAAAAHAAAAIDRSKQTARPVDRATAVALTAFYDAVREEPETAAQRADEAIAVADEYGYRQWAALARVIAAWVAALSRPSEAVLEQLLTRIDEWSVMDRASLSAILCLAADAHIRAAQRDTGLALLERAEVHARDTGERWYVAEIHRLRGTAALVGQREEAEGHFQRAIDIARTQGSRLWELPASIDLARLWQQEKRLDAALGLLTPVLATFARAPETRDLRNARHLQAELAGSG